MSLSKDVRQSAVILPPSELEKKTFTYKFNKEEDLSLENIEIVLLFFDRTKFELNICKYKSTFDIDLEQVFKYPSNQNSDKIDNNNLQNKNCFNSTYNHNLVTGKYELIDNVITLKLEKVELVDKNLTTITVDYNGKSISLKSDNAVNKLVGIKEDVTLTLFS